MLEKIHTKKNLQLFLGLLIGFGFGFLLQKSQVTKYNFIMAQLLLIDFTVVKVMMTAIVTGMIGVYLLKHFKLVKLHPKPGSVGSTVIGGLIFGIGLGVLGYCPGTVTGAAGQGSLDALLGGIPGFLTGVWIYSIIFPKLQNSILPVGSFGKKTIPELCKVNPWIVILIMSAAIIIFLIILENYNL